MQQERCCAALHFLHALIGAFVGGWTGDVFVAELVDEDEMPVASVLEADLITLVPQIAGADACAIVQRAAIR